MNHRVYNKTRLADFLILVASAEAGSEHPLAKAIVDYHITFWNLEDLRP